MHRPEGGVLRAVSRLRRLGPSFLLLTSLLTGVTVPAWGGAPPAAQAAAAGRPPNVVIVLADDQVFGTLDGMPRLRENFIEHGVNFKQAFVTNPLCCPSRATLLTGTYSHTNTVYKNGNNRPWRNYGGMRAFEGSGASKHTLATYLDGIGYETAIFGKYMNGILGYPVGYRPPGWDYMEAFREKNGKYYDYDLGLNPCWQPRCTSSLPTVEHHGTRARDYSTDVIGKDMLQWLRHERDRSSPFFLYFTPYAPHGPGHASKTYGDDRRFLHMPPFRSPALNEADVSDKPTYIRRLPSITTKGLRAIQRFRIKQYQASFSTDRWIGRLADHLRNTGEMRDTLFIFLSDNGQTWGEHRWRYKLVPYERSIHVPFVIRYDPLDGGSHVDTQNMVLNLDILPTVLDIVNVSPVHEVEGRSLADILNGGKLARQAFLIENLHYFRGSKATVPTYCALRTTNWKYIVYSPAPEEPGLVKGPYEEELYYLPDDPFELTNVARSKPLIVDRMREKLRTLCRPKPPGSTVNWDSMG